MRISDWSSDVCSSDLIIHPHEIRLAPLLGPFFGFPMAPLFAVNWAELAVLIGPLVPDGDAVVMQELDVRVAAEDQPQLPEHYLPVNAFGGQQREPLLELETDLAPDGAVVPTVAPPQ